MQVLALMLGGWVHYSWTDLAEVKRCMCLVCYDGVDRVSTRDCFNSWPTLHIIGSFHGCSLYYNE
jgi:hypothetical protein